MVKLIKNAGEVCDSICLRCQEATKKLNSVHLYAHTFMLLLGQGDDTEVNWPKEKEEEAT